MKMTKEWKILDTDKIKPGRYVGLYADGGGAMLFMYDSGRFIESDMEEIDPEYFDGNIVLYCELPEGFKFWGEV